MDKIDLDAIIDQVNLNKGNGWLPVNDFAKVVAKEAIHQALVLASEQAHAYLDYECENDCGDPAAIIDKQSILDIEKMIV